MRDSKWMTLSITALCLAWSSMPVAHERKEVAGLAIVFGAEPEPALTGEVQFLRWRFRSVDTGDPFADLEDIQAVISKNGQDFGPFESRPSRRDPGLVQTRHIFSEPGEYDVTLTFRKVGDPDQLKVAFSYQIHDRQELVIPN